MSGSDGVSSQERPPAWRTCVGCRRRDDRSGLLRLAVDRSAGVPPPGVAAVVVPDPRCRLPGRGAWVHPRAGCLDAAEKRRAVPRALRVQGPVDLSQVRALVLAPAPPSTIDSTTEGTPHEPQHHPSTEQG